ncbi:hypothetical protein E0H36_09035 [Rhizobium leguminosarum bv. viciae]|uniref:hypothetical protein n=1 Tax=Rhizobium leguminosarum TaxID=384 RepID=UPI00103F6971|nr:hypothetical protein [Rhizobium leguminosarum]TBZ34579.1 hypothetical protein E0H36_09035 [Rhizobium leguminosarum bv. viciae]
MPSIDKEAAIRLVQEQLKSYLHDDLEAWGHLQVMQFIQKSRRSGIVEPDGQGQWLRRPGTDKRDFVRGRLLDMEKLDSLLNAAAGGDKDADLEARVIAIWLRRNRQPLPDLLLDFVINLVAAGLPKPRRRLPRDIQYCIAIRRLQEFGFSPTRNREPARGRDPDAIASGCRIVSEASTLIGEPVSERAVEQIWEKYSDRR